MPVHDEPRRSAVDCFVLAAPGFTPFVVGAASGRRCTTFDLSDHARVAGKATSLLTALPNPNQSAQGMFVYKALVLEDETPNNKSVLEFCSYIAVAIEIAFRCRLFLLSLGRVGG